MSLVQYGEAAWRSMGIAGYCNCCSGGWEKEEEDTKYSINF